MITTRSAWEPWELALLENQLVVPLKGGSSLQSPSSSYDVRFRNNISCSNTIIHAGDNIGVIWSFLTPGMLFLQPYVSFHELIPTHSATEVAARGFISTSILFHRLVEKSL